MRGPSRRNLDAPRREQGEEVRAVVAPRDLDGSLELAQARLARARHGLGLGAVVKAYDSRCMRKRDIESYRASHILWHFQMPLVFILYNVYRVWKACGEIW